MLVNTKIAEGINHFEEFSFTERNMKSLLNVYSMVFIGLGYFLGMPSFLAVKPDMAHHRWK